MKLPAIAGASPFAHLLGRAPKAATRAESDEDKKKDEEEAKRAEEDKKKEEEEEEAKRKAEEDEKKKEEEAKARRAEEDEDDNEESAKARKAERARCRAIFASPHAAGRAHVAAQLAFDTDLTSEQAVGVLASVAAGEGQVKPRGLAAAMSTVTIPNVGADNAASVDPSNPKALASRIIEAGKKRRGETA